MALQLYYTTLGTNLDLKESKIKSINIDRYYYFKQLWFRFYPIDLFFLRQYHGMSFKINDAKRIIEMTRDKH